MGRKRTKIWISSRVRLIKELVLLFLDTHPLGFNVLTGAARWPDGDEVAEWLAFVYSSGEAVHVQNEPSVFEAQRLIESKESAARAFSAFEQYGVRSLLAEHLPGGVIGERRFDRHTGELLGFGNVGGDDGG